MTRFRLKLYITGQTPRSRNAIAQLEELCSARYPGRYDIEVIDVLERPAMAERDEVLATPTVVRVQPPPPCRVVGDLSDFDRVAVGLGMVRDNRE